MTAKKAFEKLQEIVLITFDLDGYDEELEIINKSLNDYEELKQEIARYFELQSIDFWTNKLNDEYKILREKLLKVGKL